LSGKCVQGGRLEWHMCAGGPCHHQAYIPSSIYMTRCHQAYIPSSICVTRCHTGAEQLYLYPDAASYTFLASFA